jgi:diguanylate cyclase (GGDEF)-like protein
LREFDLLGRLGGEEFALLLPNIDQTGAYQLAERLRCLVEDSPYTTVDLMIPLTVSIGLKALDNSVETLNHLIEQADKSLYEAKKMGRNRVIINDSHFDQSP